MKFIDIKKIHQGKFLTYYIASYSTKSGSIKEYELVSRNPNLTNESFGNNGPVGVGLVTFSVDKKKILLSKEFRLATKRFVYNFPAGLIDEGESPLEAAKRELKEETGLLLVDTIAVLSPSYASQGTSDELMTIVICTCEGEIKESCYEVEEIKAKWYTKKEVQSLLDRGEYMSVRTQMFLWQWVNGDLLK